MRKDIIFALLIFMLCLAISIHYHYGMAQSLLGGKTLTTSTISNGQIVVIQGNVQGYIQILTNMQEWVNPSATPSIVLSDTTYQFKVGNVGTGTLQTPSTTATVTATLESVKYPGSYLSVTPTIIPGIPGRATGEYGLFVASPLTSLTSNYYLEFVQNDANTMFWTQLGTGTGTSSDVAGGTLKAFVGFVDSVLYQSDTWAVPYPFIFTSIPTYTKT